MPSRVGGAGRSENGCWRYWSPKVGGALSPALSDGLRLNGVLKALEHRVHVGIGLDHSQQPGRGVVLDQRLGLRIVDLEPFADPLFLVVRALDEPRHMTEFLQMQCGVRGRRVYVEHLSAILADSACRE